METAKPIPRPTSVTVYVLARLNEHGHLDIQYNDVNRNSPYLNLNELQQQQTLRALKGEYWNIYSLEMPL